MDDSDYEPASQGDVACQFQLPERQSKINQLIRAMEEGEGNEPVQYCICRSTDGTQFMIGCDFCEEWFHGNCIGVTKHESKSIKKYFCDTCRAKNPHLRVVYKKQESKYSTETRPERVGGSKKSSRRCGECTACHVRQDCGRCDFCKDMRKFGGPNRLRQKCRLRQCLNFKRSVTHSFRDFPSRKHQTTDRKKDSKRKKPKAQAKLASRHHSTHHESERPLQEDKYEPKQCYGPRCIQSNRPGSKYCSDECGLKLASQRVYELLPQRIQQWNASPCIAEGQNKRTLEGIRGQQIEARQKLLELDTKHRRLDQLVTRGKQATILQEQEITDGGEEESELSVYCVTCGHEVNTKGALRHMEKCFMKYEGQTSFGSIFKTRIEGSSMFCDFYNPKNETYCKRLKVMCPEHSKEPKVSADDVCGCPLMGDNFQETAEICRAAKRKCNKHYCWEKIRRAQIDMERVRQWLSIDDLFEQERLIKMTMSNRAGVLGLMLHQTIDHDSIMVADGRQTEGQTGEGAM